LHSDPEEDCQEYRIVSHSTPEPSCVTAENLFVHRATTLRVEQDDCPHAPTLFYVYLFFFPIHVPYLQVRPLFKTIIIKKYVFVADKLFVSATSTLSS